ncbi:quinone-dependent dihydroorotate dehydrogenase [Nakamurella silvestris]|nr:quinone-dependent dihydroorotate dehydrogenase [Nakamurella silvestris]
MTDTAYRSLARPVLFRLGKGDAETAHHSTLRLLGGIAGRPAAASALRRAAGSTGRPATVFGVDFPSVVGLAAGMDKDGLALKAWPALGFGFTEVGTVTALAQPGNERPRLFRLRASEGIINRMGFNNEGSAALAERLETLGGIGAPLGISLGKSKLTPVEDAVEDYLTSLRRLHTYADYIAVNVSSPNTPGLRSLQDAGPLTELLGALTAEARMLANEPARYGSPAERRHGRPVPVLVKIAPDLTDEAIAELLQVCQDTGVAGVIATNTTLGRDWIAPADRQLAAQTGGLSGAPLTVRAREVVRFVAGHTDLPVIGVGGIMSVDDGKALLDAGASLIQLYSGFIYTGPGLVRGLNRATRGK